uniref:non-specific serine/threonine protein kinase n=1 Tax=Ananas comosus var. bracteatus TaxID=296719 RepID=A0A6V7QEX2_ANACO|nr:unnamed protein product [Ananas comosus var. bracteatus]
MGNTCVGPSIAKSGFFQSVSALCGAPGRRPTLCPRAPPMLPIPYRTTGQRGVAGGIGAEAEDGECEGGVQLRAEAGAGAVRDDVPVHGEGGEGEGVRVQVDTEEEAGDGGGRGGRAEGDPDNAPPVGARERGGDRGAYEDAVAVHLVMELCAGGELFDRIVQKGHYTERKAAQLARVIVGVVEACHSLGVMHRDLKPENFLFADHSEEAPLKTIDFGLSVFFRPGEVFTDVVGSPYYVAPEVLRKKYGPEADVWSAGVIIYILLCGVPPFWAESEQGIFEEVLHGKLDFQSEPWPSISESAKDLVRRMLVRDPKKRLTAHEVLRHPWVQVGGVAPDKPLDSAVLSRLKQFSAMNKLKKMAFRVIAESLSEDEIAGLREMFKMIDTDNSGQITFDELKAGLQRVGANLKESEIYALMQAADVDNSGTIDYGEFIAATLHMNKIEKEDHLFAAFSYFDKDGSGYITQDELQQACEEFGIEDVRLEEMIREVDQDNDGRIDYSEFVAMMQKGNTGFGKKGLQSNFSIGFREAFKLG